MNEFQIQGEIPIHEWMSNKYKISLKINEWQKKKLVYSMNPPINLLSSTIFFIHLMSECMICDKNEIRHFHKRMKNTVN